MWLPLWVGGLLADGTDFGVLGWRCLGGYVVRANNRSLRNCVIFRWDRKMRIINNNTRCIGLQLNLAIGLILIGAIRDGVVKFLFSVGRNPMLARLQLDV